MISIKDRWDIRLNGRQVLSKIQEIQEKQADLDSKVEGKKIIPQSSLDCYNPV